MKKKSLLETNPYLKDPAECEAAILRNVATSSAIEGVTLSAFGGVIPFRGTNREASPPQRRVRSITSSKIFSIGP